MHNIEANELSGGVMILAMEVSYASLLSVCLLLLSPEGMKLLPPIPTLFHSNSKSPLLRNCFFTPLFFLLLLFSSFSFFFLVDVL